MSRKPEISKKSLIKRFISLCFGAQECPGLSNVASQVLELIVKCICDTLVRYISYDWLRIYWTFLLESYFLLLHLRYRGL